jgi:hypothetical protein
MTLSDHQVALSGQITLGDGTDYHITQITGLDRAIRTVDTDRPNAHGAVQGPDYAPPRNIVIDLNIDKSSASAAVAAYDALAAAWNSTAGTEGAMFSGTLQWKLPGQNQRRISGRPRRLIPNWEHVESGWIPCVAEFFAPDPRMLSETEHTVDLVIAASNVTIPNAGNHPASVWWDVYGAITSPGVIRSEAARFDLTGITIADGGYFRVRTDPKTVTRSTDSANRYEDISGTFLEIPAGGALFRAVGTSPGTHAKIRATYRDTWL